MDFLTDSRDQFFKSYIHLIFHGLKSIISFVYSINKSSKRNYDDFNPAPRPLMNIGLNCYLNSAFQSIAACPKFVHEMKILENMHPTAKNLIVFNRILSALSNSSQESLKITSNDILRNWNKDGEQDTFELLSHILSQVFNELKNVKQSHNSDKTLFINHKAEESLPLHISMLFKIQCSLGHNSAPIMQSDLAIHLAIPFRITTEELSMEKLLDNYFIEEDISDCKCINYSCKAQVSKFVTLKKPLPSTLCIHLQRSFWNSNIGAMQKNNEKVKFREMLTMKGNYFNPTRNTKCVEGLLFRTFSSIIDDAIFTDKSDYFENKNVVKKEFSTQMSDQRSIVVGGDVTNNKETTYDREKYFETEQSNEIVENISEILKTELNLKKDEDNYQNKKTENENFKYKEIIIEDITNVFPANSSSSNISENKNNLSCDQCEQNRNLNEDTEIKKCENNFDKTIVIDPEIYLEKSSNENNDEKINFNYKNENYLLKSVITHFGNPESGHYICHRKCGDKWFCTNDSFIREVSIRDVLSSEAYILMYEKDC